LTNIEGRYPRVVGKGRGLAYAPAMTDRRRAKSERPVLPSPPDLPEALSLSWEAPVELRAVEVRERNLSASDLSGRDATSLRLIESRVEGVDLSDTILRGASIRDTVVEGGNWANADAAEAAMSRVELRHVRLTGTVLAGAKIKDVTFIECRLALASMRFAQLDRSGLRTVEWRRRTSMGRRSPLSRS
jgi:hypothetical protein